MIDLGLGYDSNPGQGVVGVDDWKAQFLPAISVTVPGSSITLDARAQLSIETYFGTAAGASSDAFVGGNINVAFSAGSSDSVVGFELAEALIRTPTFISFEQEGLGAVGADEVAFLQWYNRGDANVVLRPGGGALEFRIGYGNELRLFDSSSESQKHMANVEAKLRFLPKTAVAFNADLGFYSDTADFKANPYNLSLALLGQITEGLTVIARLGYGDTLAYLQGEAFFGATSPSNIRSVITNLRLEYTFASGTSLSAGYDRSVRQAIGSGNGYASDSPYLRAEVQIGDRFTLAALGRVEFRTFAAIAPTSRVYVADARVDYWFFEFLRGGLAYMMIVNEADVGGAVGLQLPDGARHQVLLTTGLYY
jgi:hypothetical protein